MAYALTAGTPVRFADIHGEFTGRIVGPITNIENGRRMFAIEVDHALRGIVHIVGADTIQPFRYPETSNYPQEKS